MIGARRNSQWVTVVLLTVVLILIFLVFFGKNTRPPLDVTGQPTTVPVVPMTPETPKEQNQAP